MSHPHSHSSNISSPIYCLHSFCILHPPSSPDLMKFPFFCNPEPPPSWPWPACATNPKTLSFRANHNTDIFKTINSAFLDVHEFCDDEFSGADESAVVGALRSDRLFFNPGETSSILDEAKSQSTNSSDSQNDAVSVMALESRDPYGDFRASMEEMVAALGLKDWDGLEDLLTCYLRVNSPSNHGYIVRAFVDLLLRLAATKATAAIDENCSSSSTTTTATQNSFTSPLSFSSSSPTYSSPEIETPISVGAGENEKGESEASVSNHGSD